MTGKDLLQGAPALLGAVTAAFAGNQGGVVLAFVLIILLILRLRRCEQKHEESDAKQALADEKQEELEAKNQRLTITLVQLVSAFNAQQPAGVELISAAALEDMLQGKPASGFMPRKGTGRRDSDRGRMDGEDDAAGGAGDVPG